jgi:methylmalonyl-CoA mutase C-terminal domain/subunit
MTSRYGYEPSAMNYEPLYTYPFLFSLPLHMPNPINRPIRVLVAKVGLDGHDRGARIIATSLRDAGMEVIYTGLRQTPEMVVNTALQEDVDAIGISILSGAHMTVFPKIMQILKDKGMDDVLVTGGGIIPQKDMEKLQQIGVGKLFTPGASTEEIAAYIREWTGEHRNFEIKGA